MSTFKIGIWIIIALAMSAGAWAIYQNVRCNSLEEDFLNSMAFTRRAAALRHTYAVTSEMVDMADTMQRVGERDIQKTVKAMHRQCGEQAVNTAIRRAGNEAGI